MEYNDEAVKTTPVRHKNVSAPSGAFSLNVVFAIAQFQNDGIDHLDATEGFVTYLRSPKKSRQKYDHFTEAVLLTVFGPS